MNYRDHEIEHFIKRLKDLGDDLSMHGLESSAAIVYDAMLETMSQRRPEIIAEMDREKLERCRAVLN